MKYGHRHLNIGMALAMLGLDMAQALRGVGNANARGVGDRPFRRSSRFDKATLGPGCGRGSGVRAWRRWHRKSTPDRAAAIADKYLHAAARRRKHGG